MLHACRCGGMELWERVVGVVMRRYGVLELHYFCVDVEVIWRVRVALYACNLLPGISLLPTMGGGSKV